MESMKVLVTGATGFMGSYVVAELLERGHHVRVFARRSSDVSALPANVEVTRGELKEGRGALEGMNGIVHLAGVSGRLMRRSRDDEDELWTVNVEGTEAVFEAARAASVSRGVLVTTMWTVLRPDLATRSRYIASRLASEAAAIRASRDGLAATIVCPTFVVGAGDRGPNFPGALILRLAEGRLPVVPQGGMTWIAVRDAARAISNALERGRPHERYLIGAEHVSYRDLAARVTRAAGQSASSLTVPRALMRCGAAVADLGIWLSRRVLPIPLRVGVDLLSLDGPIDCSRAVHDLGAPVECLDDAILEAITWFRDRRSAEG